MRYISAIFAVVFAMIFSFWPQVVLAGERVGIYGASPMVWSESGMAVKNFFTVHNIAGEKFFKFENLDRFSAIVVPGGWAGHYATFLSEKERENIKAFIKNGGSAVGICAGAYFFSRHIFWKGALYEYGLGVFDGTARGPLEYAPWPSFAFIPVVTDVSRLNVLYYGGPEFIEIPKGTHLSQAGGSTVIARWPRSNYPAAAIIFPFEKGKVMLIGFHPEIGFDYSTNQWDLNGGHGAAWPWFLGIFEKYGILEEKK